MEVETSISTGPRGVGKPTASGLGENTARVPPNGATVAAAGADENSSIT